MEVLSYGFKKPENTDTGDVVFPALQDNIQQLNDHTHDGQNSAFIAQARAQLSAGSWSAPPVPLAPYSYTGSLPDGKTFDNTVIIFSNYTNGSIVPLDLEKTSDTEFTVYTNNPIDYWVLFL